MIFIFLLNSGDDVNFKFICQCRLGELEAQVIISLCVIHKVSPRPGMEDSLSSSRVVHPHRHWIYVWLPLVGAAVWFG